MESIEIYENFDDLNETQKYQLKVPLFRNEKQYVTELENNVNYFLNQIGKNNYITDDQMEVVMPRYVQKEKRKRVNRAKMQADKLKKEVDQLRREERQYGKAQFHFANELPDIQQKPRPDHPSFTYSKPPLDVLKYIQTEEYKDYKYQYKPYQPTQQLVGNGDISKISISASQLKERNKGSISQQYPQQLLTEDQQESLLMEKSSAYLLEHSKMEKKWASSFKNMGTAEKGNLMKNYKGNEKGILSAVVRNGNKAEPTEDEVLVSNNNLAINQILNNIQHQSNNNNGQPIKTPDNYIFQEFIQLAKQSQDSLHFASETTNSQHKSSLKEDSKKINIKLLQLRKDSEKFVLLKLFKNHFQPILEKNTPAIMTRIFLALNMNPHEDYSRVNWKEYCLFNKIVVDQSASVIDSVNFIVRFFGIEEKKYMRRIEFMALLRLVCGKFDEFLLSKGKSSLFELLEQNLTVLGFLREDTDFVSLSELRALLLSHRINYETLLQLIITNL